MSGRTRATTLALGLLDSCARPPSTIAVLSTTALDEGFSGLPDPVGPQHTTKIGLGPDRVEACVLLLRVSGRDECGSKVERGEHIAGVLTPEIVERGGHGGHHRGRAARATKARSVRLTSVSIGKEQIHKVGCAVGCGCGHDGVEPSLYIHSATIAAPLRKP